MGKVFHITSKDRSKDWSHLNPGLHWMIPIHEALNTPETKAQSQAVEERALKELAEKGRQTIPLRKV